MNAVTWHHLHQGVGPSSPTSAITIHLQTSMVFHCFSHQGHLKHPTVTLSYIVLLMRHELLGFIHKERVGARVVWFHYPI